MAQTLTRKIIKPLLNDSHTVFNDKLADGRRSLKVWGWSEATYDKAKQMLIDAGCRVEMEWTPEVEGYRCSGGNIRLHVREK